MASAGNGKRAPHGASCSDDGGLCKSGFMSYSGQGPGAVGFARRPGANPVRHPCPEPTTTYNRQDARDCGEHRPRCQDSALPELPTVEDFVPGYEAAWYGIGAPRNTSVEIVDSSTRGKSIAAIADPRNDRQACRHRRRAAAGLARRVGKAHLRRDREGKKWAKVVSGGRPFKPEVEAGLVLNKQCVAIRHLVAATRSVRGTGTPSCSCRLRLLDQLNLFCFVNREVRGPSP